MGECWIPPGARDECWIPPGHVTLRSLVERHGAEKMREDLYLGCSPAFKLCPFTGKLHPIAREEWASSKAPYWLGLNAPPEFPLSSLTANDGSFEWYLLTYDPDFYIGPERILVRVADNPVSQPSLDGLFITESMAIMIGAIRHFGISDKSWPKAEVLKQYFLEQKLSTGTRISDTQADYLVTFCRPPAAMKGGNKRR